jgi:Putative S-adenosyl-L-methionine-dependent methyltransferase
VWRERLVDVAVRQDLEADFRDDDDDETPGAAVKPQDAKSSNSGDARKGEEEETAAEPGSPAPTTTTSAADILKGKKKPRLRIVLAPEVTPPLKTLLGTDDDGRLVSNVDGDTAPLGSIVEVSPEACLWAQDVAAILAQQGGAALIIDYGSELGSSDSLRGYTRHEQVHFLSRPGEVDITADVDFAALKRAVEQQSERQKDGAVVRAFGPVSQGEFLMAMGIQERVIDLMQRDSVSDEQAENLYHALVRLVSPEEMGERYKVMAIASTTTSANRSTMNTKQSGGKAVANTEIVAPVGFDKFVNATATATTGSSN